MRLFLLLVGIAVTSPVTTPLPAEPQNGFGGNAAGVPIHGTGLIVVAPESRDSLAAWSHEAGVWSRIPIQATEDDAIVPIVGTGVAAARVGKMVYGYGADAGKWHWIKTETANPPSVGTGQVTIQDGDWYYALSSKSGRWSGINLQTGEIR
jgi:hypothetical protein